MKAKELHPEEKLRLLNEVAKDIFVKHCYPQEQGDYVLSNRQIAKRSFELAELFIEECENKVNK